LRLAAGNSSFPSRDDSAENTNFQSIIAMLVEREVSERVARRIMLDIPDDQIVEDQIDWIDKLVSSPKERLPIRLDSMSISSGTVFYRLRDL